MRGPRFYRTEQLEPGGPGLPAWVETEFSIGCGIIMAARPPPRAVMAGKVGPVSAPRTGSPSSGKISNWILIRRNCCSLDLFVPNHNKYGTVQELRSPFSYINSID